MRMTVRRKLLLATGIVFTLVIIVSLIGIWSIWRVGMGVTIIKEHCTVNRCWNADVIKELKVSFEKVSTPVHEYLASGNRKHIEEFERSVNSLERCMEEALKMTLALEESQFAPLKQLLSIARQGILDINLLAKQIFAEADPTKPDPTKPDPTKPDPTGNTVSQPSTETLTVVPKSLKENIGQKVLQLEMISQEMGRQLDSLLKFYTEDTRIALERASELRFNFAVIMVSIFLLLALANLGAGFILAREITTPIQNLVQATHRVASGELTYKVPISSSDEIGELARHFNAMIGDLQKSQEKLVANERLATLGTFVSYVSHELRNPLSVLRNCVFYLERQNSYDESTFRRYGKIMQEEINAAQKIIDDCLTFSRDKRLDLKITNLNSLLEKALTQAEIPEHIHIGREFYEDLPSIMVDEGQIQQVFANIITNAVMVMSGQGELRIATVRGEDYQEIIFTDTGSGIPEHNLTKVFDPFFTTKKQGTGLGLAICKFIIEKHGGLIWAENAPIQGASFFIRLPFEPSKKLVSRQEEKTLVSC